MQQQPISTDTSQEIARIEAEYQRCDSGTTLTSRYSLFNEAALLHAQSLERHILSLLKRHRFVNLTEKKILDVGCGGGGILQSFLRYGARSQNLSGIDLMDSRIEQARSMNPCMDWRVASAHQLPYHQASFDLVMSLNVFSSILNQSLRRKIADEMWRVRKSGGLILFYDFTYSNPRNPAVRGITHQEVTQLFDRPRANFDFRRITLAPPIARLVAPLSYWLASTIEQFGIVNTHIVGIISLD